VGTSRREKKSRVRLYFFISDTSCRGRKREDRVAEFEEKKKKERGGENAEPRKSVFLSEKENCSVCSLTERGIFSNFLSYLSTFLQSRARSKVDRCVMERKKRINSAFLHQLLAREREKR